MDYGNLLVWCWNYSVFTCRGKSQYVYSSWIGRNISSNLMRRILLRGSSHPEGTSSASVVSFVKYFVIVLKFTRRFFKEMPKSCIFSDLSPNLQLEEFSIFLKFDVKWNNNNNKSASIFPFINQKTLPIIISDQIIVLCMHDS